MLCRDWKAALERAALFVLLFTLCFLPATGVTAQESAPIVTAIEFAPTQYLTEDEMRSAVTETKIGEPLDSDKLLADMLAIHELGTEKHGVQVFYDFEAELIPHSDGVKVVIYPIEMPVIKGFVVDIDVVDEDEFLAVFPMETGRLLSDDTIQTLYSSIEQAIEGLFERTGYFFNLTDLRLEEDETVYIQLRAVRIASITIEGNEKTRDYVIAQEIESVPGEPLNVQKINEDIRRIFHLRHFEDVGAELEENPDDPQTVDVVYYVVERQTGMAGFGAGYSSSEGLVGYLELADENLFGRGQYASIRAEFGGKKTAYDLSFSEPNVGGTRTSFGFGLYNRTFRYEENEESHAAGGNITLGKRFTDYLRGSLRLKAENTRDVEREVTPGDDDPEPEEIVKTTERRVRSIQLGLSGDTTDRPFYPTQGMRYSASTEFAMEILGGNTEFSKYEGQWSTYHKVGRADQVIALRLMGGYAPSDLPLQEKFRVGGPDTVRGYRFGHSRGEKMVVGNAEYRFKISDNIQGAIFADVGQAWTVDENPNFEDLLTSAGIGIRFDTPLGMMRLDYGIGKNGGRLEFGIGPAF